MPAKLDRCVRKVKAKGQGKNPWAICNAALSKGGKRRQKTKRKGHGK